MKTQFPATKWFGLSLALLSCPLLLLMRVGAATVLSGNVSGTWTTNGSPYILSADCSVASNQTLTILPEVEVIIGRDVQLWVFGGITAVGMPEQPIRIRGVNSTSFWQAIQMTYSGFTNRFHFCRISEGRGALSFLVNGGNRVMSMEVLNCDFLNCDAAIVGAAYGNSIPRAPAPAGAATLLGEIHNCVFDLVEYGLNLQAFSEDFPGNGTANPTLTGNIFKNVREAAVYANGGYTNVSRPVFMNNTVVDAKRGIYSVGSNFDFIIRNSLFVRNSTAVFRSTGYPGSYAGYNCFFNNTANFVGYPGIYGEPVINNHSGDPCDAFFNIFLDPQFLDTNRFLLRNSSPCIDAGDPAIADVCFQFSRGSAISDIGAYGGPEVCGWLTHGFAPVITAPPVDQSGCVGGSATFKVRVEGSEPLDYRWYFGPTPLAGETNAQLTLANLQSNQAGLYSVTVSNGFGSVSSASARLVVSDACVGIHAYAGLSITGLVGRTYNVEYVTNLAATNWTFVASNTFTQPAWLFLDTNTPVNVRRFFRVRLLP